MIIIIKKGDFVKCNPLDSCVMPEALIKADMFSNSPQERPEETVPEGGGEKNTRPQMVPCNISSSVRQMSPGGRKIVGVIRLREKKNVSQFSLGVL